MKIPLSSKINNIYYLNNFEKSRWGFSKMDKNKCPKLENQNKFSKNHSKKYTVTRMLSFLFF